MLSLTDLLPRMVRCRQSVRLAVAADVLWAVVGDLASTVPGGGMVERISLEGDGAGAIRTFHLPGSARIVERIEEHDPALRRYVYRIIDAGPLPVANYLGVAEIMASGPDAAILSWSATADPLDGDAESLSTLLDANLTAAVQAVAAHFGQSTG